MFDLEYWKSKSQECILEAIRDRSALIVTLQKTADTKGFSGPAPALELQKFRKERAQLRRLLKPLTLVVDNSEK